MVMTQTGRSAMSSAARGARASDVARAASEATRSDHQERELDARTDALAKVHALAVTDANVYSFWIPAWRKVAAFARSRR